ncbi:MAG TPA: hypothetical protein VGM30_19395 [Puia sp.]|jgi:hypothetical protein
MEKIFQILVVFALIMVLVTRFIRGKEQKFREYSFFGRFSFPMSGDLYRELLSVPMGMGEGMVAAADPENRLLFRPGPENSLVIADERTGEPVASVALEESADALLFDPMTRLLYCGSLMGTLTIVRQSDPRRYRIVQRLNIPPGCTSLSLDPHNGKVYLHAGAFVHVYFNG